MKHARFLGLAAAILAVFPAFVWPQASGPEEGRLLGGHRFIPSEFVAGPFITTDFTTLTGLGFASASVTVSGSTTTFNLGALSQSMRMQYAPTDWLAIRAGAAGLVFSGIDQDAALNFGATVGYGLLVGASAGWRFDRLRVAGSLDINSGQTYTFNILSAINASVTAGTVSAATLLTSTRNLMVTPSAQVAYGFSPTLGAFGNAGFSFANATTAGVTQSSSALNAGGGLSIDLQPGSQVPIGFLAAYNLEVDFPPGGAASTTSHQFAGGVFYTGRPNLALGIEARATLSSPSPQVTLTVIEAVFGVHYFW
jgi:hypothetical protein